MIVRSYAENMITWKKYASLFTVLPHGFWGKFCMQRWQKILTGNMLFIAFKQCRNLLCNCSPNIRQYYWLVPKFLSENQWLLINILQYHEITPIKITWYKVLDRDIFLWGWRSGSGYFLQVKLIFPIDSEAEIQL